MIGKKLCILRKYLDSPIIFRRKMCILFMFNGAKDDASYYSFILISNRDEYFKRPAKNMAPWKEDSNIIGGRDLETGCESGTWLAVTPSRNKLGVLLNIPTDPKPNAISRGRVVDEFVKSNLSTAEYVEYAKLYSDNCNDFILVTAEFCNLRPSVYTFSNSTNQLTHHEETFLGFSNSLPDDPLKKTEAGRMQLQEICNKYNKVEMKNELINELLCLLKSKERHLPDPQLEKRRPKVYQQLSSIFVSIPEAGYGTRTHTIVLLTKTGQMDIIEITLQSPIDIQNPNWQKNEYQFNLCYQ